jgi:putative transposase
VEGRPVKLWFTAAEFAQLAITGDMPGLPTTKRGMNVLIDREAWAARPGLCRPRQGREGGGGDEFHLDNLPLPARLAYAKRFLTPAPEDMRPPIGEHDRLSAKARLCRDARLVVLKLADGFRADNALSIAAGDHLFAGLFNGRSMDLPAWVRAAIGTISTRTLARWRTMRDSEGDDALGHDPAAARKGTGALDRALDGAVKTLILAAIAKQPFLSAKHVRALVAERFDGAFALPPLRTFQHALKLWRADYRNELVALTDPDGYRSRIEFSATNATRTDRLNELWQIDASPADVMLTEGRHSIYLAIDAFSRRVMVLVSKTPRAAAVAMLIRKAILDWGVPEKIKTDNGSDFTATATARLFAALGIEIELSPVYAPKTKGMVERAIGTFQRDLAALPGFVGHSVADRKIIENRKAFARRAGADPAELFGVDMDFAAFQSWCDDWAGTIYAHTPHRGLGNRTPFVAAAAFTGQVRRIETPAALNLLIAAVPGKDGLRTVTKSGIRIDGADYLTAAAMPGTTAFCRMDPADLGRVLVFTADGETFLGEAFAPELAGLDPVETIARVKARQKAELDGRVADIKKQMRRIGPRDVADAMRNQAARRSATVIALPRKASPHATPALRAAEAATQPTRPAALESRAAQLHAALQAETPALVSNVTRLRRGETREDRFQRVLAIESALARGEQPAAEELVWLGGYQPTSEYRAMRSMVDEFGAEAMGLKG